MVLESVESHEGMMFYLVENCGVWNGGEGVDHVICVCLPHACIAVACRAMGISGPKSGVAATVVLSSSRETPHRVLVP